MPSIVAMGISAAFDLPARAHVVDQGAESIKAQLRRIAVGFGLGVDPLLRVADGGMRQAHATVEPRPSAQAPDDWNGNPSSGTPGPWPVLRAEERVPFPSSGAWAEGRGSTGPGASGLPPSATPGKGTEP